MTSSSAGDTRAANSPRLAGSSCTAPRAHMKPTSAENTKTVHVGDAPLPDGRVWPSHVHAIARTSASELCVPDAPGGHHSAGGNTELNSAAQDHIHC